MRMSMVFAHKLCAFFMKQRKSLALESCRRICYSFTAINNGKTMIEVTNRCNRKIIDPIVYQVPLFLQKQLLQMLLHS